MADIGAVWKRSAVAERTLVNGWVLGLVLATQAVQSSVGAVLPLPRTDVGRRLAGWTLGAVAAVRARLTTRAMPSEPRKRYHHPRRESFIEDAAMSREMFRL
jgi:hypothetical protein